MVELYNQTMSGTQDLPGYVPAGGVLEAEGPVTDREYQELAALLRRIRALLRASQDQARAAGITPQQHALLLTVRGHPSYPNVTIGNIAENLQLRHHSASVLVDRMVKGGLLQRREDPKDRRRVIVGLTGRGLHILEDVTRSSRRQRSSVHGLLADPRSGAGRDDVLAQD